MDSLRKAGPIGVKALGYFFALSLLSMLIGLVVANILLALIVGIDLLLNEGRVLINVLGDALATVVIGKWENDFDAGKARRKRCCGG